MMIRQKKIRDHDPMTTGKRGIGEGGEGRRGIEAKYAKTRYEVVLAPIFLLVPLSP